MIPIMYRPTETEFTSNGLGRLRDCIRAEVTEERNSIYELQLDYPINGKHYNDISIGNIILVEHDDSGDLQPFDIYGCSKPINGVVTFYGCHVSYRQNYITSVLTHVTSLSSALSQIANAYPTNPFTYYTDKSVNSRLPIADGRPRTVREILGGVEGSILDTYGGEFLFDRWKVSLLNQRGKQSGLTIRYGVNMLEFTEDLDYSESYNSVLPYWTGDAGSGETTILGDPVIMNAATYDGQQKCIPLDLSEKFDTPPTPQALEEYAERYMVSNQTNLPHRNIKIDFVNISDSDEYNYFSELHKCRLCDSIKVVFPFYNMSSYFKIVRVVWDVLQERYKEIELGNLATSLSDALGISEGGQVSTNTSTRVIETGHITGTSVPKNDYVDYEIAFTKTFPTAPTVVACFQSTSTAGLFGRCTLGVVSVSVSGATIRVFNGDESSGRAPNIDWIAVKV